MSQQGNTMPRFELGLCLSGAVSGGAYTAGALDFIVEALDAWHDARARNDLLAPSHSVVVSSMAGTSSGALTAATLVAAIDRGFPHVNHSTAEIVALNNPLYDGWVNMIGLTDLLGTGDQRHDPLQSLFDPTKIEQAARKAIAFGEGVPRKVRPWVADPFRVSFTLTNLRGVTYAMPGAPVKVTTHADAIRFAFATPGGTPGHRASRGERHFSLACKPLERWVAWGSAFAQAALASSAFPVALVPRTLSRPYSDYELPLAGMHSISPQPIDQAPDAPYRFAAVDGGVTNNSPLELVEADLNHRPAIPDANASHGNQSTRAVLMISAFSEDPPPGPDTADGLSLRRIAASLAATLLTQARFRPIDVALGLSPNVYNRFLLTPGLDNDNADSPHTRRLAGDFLAGFGGYLSRDFRRHDYLVGRRDAQHYLACIFTLPPGNPLFAQWTPAQRSFYEEPVAGELPIIPLVGTLHPGKHREPRPVFPAGKAQLAQIEKAVGTRLDLLYCRLVRGKLLRLFIGIFWCLFIRWWLRKRIIAFITSALKDQGLA